MSRRQPFSQSWYLVENLRCRLRSNIQLHRHSYRGQVWYLLQDEIAGQFHRFSPEAYQLIARMDGRRTVDAIWREACDALGDQAPGQDEVIELIGKLYRANALQTDAAADAHDLYQRHQSIRRSLLVKKLKSPLGIKLPLFDPDRFLNATWPWISPLFGVKGLILWLVVLVAGVVSGLQHLDSFTENLSDQTLSAGNLLVMLVVYPLIKAIHELGHAYAVKKWGGEVHEIGIMFLVFFPVPYVEATAATAFPSKYARMLVAGAGILVEVFLAALAMLAWTWVEPGLTRALLFNTVLIAGVSTLLFNGNPLLKFDAYYVLSDWLEIPNMAARANRQVGYVIKRYLFGVQDVQSQAASRRESAWLLGYAVAAFCYRLMVLLLISVFVVGKFFLLGVLLAMWAVWMGVIYPAIQTARQLFVDPQLTRRKARVWGTTAMVAGALVVFFFILPMPYATAVKAIVMPPESSAVRAAVDGEIAGLVQTPSENVAQGAPLLTLDSSQLNQRVAFLEAGVREAALQYQAQLSDRTASTINRELLAYRERELAHAQQQQASLTLTAPQAGEWVLLERDRWQGRPVIRGELLGYVLAPGALPLIALVADQDMERVINDTQRIELRFDAEPATTYSASFTRFTPAAIDVLPHAGFAAESGGWVATRRGPEGQQIPLQKHFMLALQPEDAAVALLNSRATIVFRHTPAPLAARIYRAFRQLFLKRFDA